MYILSFRENQCNFTPFGSQDPLYDVNILINQQFLSINMSSQDILRDFDRENWDNNSMDPHDSHEDNWTPLQPQFLETEQDTTIIQALRKHYDISDGR